MQIVTAVRCHVGPIRFFFPERSNTSNTLLYLNMYHIFFCSVYLVGAMT